MSDNIQFINLDNLILDDQNPRLPESLARDEGSMIDYIAESTSIEELMEVIAKNDYFIGEPVIAVPERNANNLDTGKFIVVEGNRRLTALKLLQNPTSAKTAGTKVHEIAGDPQSFKPTSIPVVVRENREQVLPYLGFRHITGIKQWEPLAKARFMEQLLATTEDTLLLQERYAKVAKIIGSQRPHIQRSIRALEVYKIIKNNDYFEIEDLDEEKIKFAVLYTAIADERIGSFIGLTNGNANDETSNLNVANIKDLTEWLYKKDKKRGQTKVGESRNLRLLSAVVSNDKALAAFRSGATLKVAYSETADVSKDFLELLYSADTSLIEASSMVATLEYDEDAVRVARRVFDNVKLIGRELQNKKDSDDAF